MLGEPGRARLDEHEDWLGNTDGDDNSATIPLLARKAKMEVVDAWGVPFAYFCAKLGGYEGAQMIRTAGSEGFPGEDIQARPHQNPRNGLPLGPRTFQLISAGADGEFNTEDDIVYPNPPRD